MCAPIEALAHPLAGLLVGLAVGLTGVGGGALMTPALVLLFGTAPATAIGTDLWFAAGTKAAAGAMHQRRGTLDREVLRRLWLGSLPGALLTLVALHTGLVPPAREGLLETVLGAVLLATALAMLLRAPAQAWGTILRTRSPLRFKRAQPSLTVAAGALLGVLVTLTSIGAGALGAALLVTLYPFRMKEPARLVGTDVVHAIPLTLVAGTGHLLLGNVDLALLGMLLLGSVPGALLGTRLSGALPAALVRTCIAILIAVAGLELVT